MGKSLHQQVSFAGGEWAPKLDARVDQQKYASALRQCCNVIPYKTGGLTRRPGSQYIGAAKKASAGSNNYSVREIPFIFSPTTTFNLEFGDHYIRFYSNGVQVTVSSAPLWVSGTYYRFGSYVEDPTDHLIYLAIVNTAATTQPHLLPLVWVQTNILECPVTPYGANAGASGNIYDTDIWKIAYCQINDVVFLAHPDYPPWVLTRITDTHWTMEQVVFNDPALLDRNATDTKITPSAVQGANITLTATAPAWVSAHSYNLFNSVQVTGIIYDCTQEHVSGATFAADLALGYWTVVTVFRAATAFSTWQLSTLRNSGSVEYTGTAAGGFSAGSSKMIQVFGSWEVHTYGVWAGTVKVERSLDQGLTWDAVLTVTGLFDRNVDSAGKADIMAIYRITVSAVSAPTTPGPTDPRVVFECVDAYLNGLVKITTTPTAYTATADVVRQLIDPNPTQAEWISGHAYLATNQASYFFVNYTALHNVTSATPPPQDPTNWAPTAPGGTTAWSESAWSDYRGYPQAVCSFQQRVVYGGSAFEPQRIWGTVTNDLENFALGDQTLATDSFAFDLNAVGAGPITWLIGQLDLFVGFSGAEWVVNSGSTNQYGGGSGAAITATNVNAVQHSKWGSAPNVEPAVVGDALMFTQRQATSLRQMLYSVYTGKYMSQDLTTLADHLFPSGIVQIAYQSRWRKQSIVWVVTQQGTLCGMTYELDQEVFGWHRHNTGYGQFDPDGGAITPDNGFESVCVLPGQGTADDEVWVVVNRLISGVRKRYIERLNPVNWEETFSGPPNPPEPNLPDAFYVDSGKTVLAPGSRTITGLSHLEGRYVLGQADGYFFGLILVSSGSAELPAAMPAAPDVVQIGLPIRYAGQPMRIDQDARAGNTQGLIKQSSDLFIRVLNSIGGEIGNGTDGVGINQPTPLPYTPTSSAFATPELITVPTDLRITPKGQPVPDADPIIIVQGNDAKPITVLGLVRKYDITSGAA